MAVLELNAKQVRIALVTCRLASLVLDHLEDLSGSSVMAVEVGIISIGDVDADSIPDVETSHRQNISRLVPDRYDPAHRLPIARARSSTSSRWST